MLSEVTFCWQHCGNLDERFRNESIF